MGCLGGMGVGSGHRAARVVQLAVAHGGIQVKGAVNRRVIDSSVPT
jgi:hypothetical protein